MQDVSSLGEVVWNDPALKISFGCAACGTPSIPYRMSSCHHVVCNGCYARNPNECPLCKSAASISEIPPVTAAVKASFSLRFPSLGIERSDPRFDAVKRILELSTSPSETMKCLEVVLGSASTSPPPPLPAPSQTQVVPTSLRTLTEPMTMAPLPVGAPRVAVSESKDVEPYFAPPSATPLHFTSSFKRESDGALSSKVSFVNPDPIDNMAVVDLNKMIDAYLLKNSNGAPTHVQTGGWAFIDGTEKVVRTLDVCRNDVKHRILENNRQIAPVHLLWDFDNVNPRAMKGTVGSFFGPLVKMLKEEFGVRVTHPRAFLVSQKDYGAVPDRLTELQVKMTLCGKKREQADRELSASLREAVANNVPLVVLVSSDKDFTSDVKHAEEMGTQVIVVHNAIPGTAHEDAIKLYPTLAIATSRFFSPDTDPTATDAFETADALRRKEIVVSGETVPVSDLVINAAVVEIANSPVESTGRWCTNNELGHVIGPCPFVHRLPEVCTIEGTRVSLKLLLPNRFLTWITMNRTAEGKWCTNNFPDHDPMLCQFAHRAPGVYLVDHMPFRGEDLLDNPAKAYLKQNPSKSGRRCTVALAQHDLMTCSYVHFVNRQVFEEAISTPSTVPTMELDGDVKVIVEGDTIRIRDIVHNIAAEHLYNNPSHTGRWCTNRTQHDPRTCRFVHSIGPAMRPQTSAVMTVRVENVSVPVSELVENGALRYLMDNPTKSGVYCKNPRPHPASACNFVHRCEPAAGARSGAPPPYSSN